MTDEERIEHFAVLSAVTEPSLRKIRKHFPRWARFLRERGIPVPDSPWTATAEASNYLTMVIEQAKAEPDQGKAHILRNLTRVRPGGKYKP